VAHAAIVRGHVRDVATGEAVPSVAVALDGTDFGDITNTDGYYVIPDIPPGRYELRASALGYDEFTRELDLVGDTVATIDVRLGSSPIPLKGVTITARQEEFKRETRVSSLTMTRSQTQRLPSVVESDLFRSLQAFPGVVSANDFSSASFVRGGNADQNLVLLDGVSIYNPTHLGGLFSIFDPDVITSAELLTGGFPAQYGGRLSSVLDIQTREGNARKLTGNLGASLLASKFIVEGPIPNDDTFPRATFFLTGRRTYFDQVLKVVGYGFPYYFYDLAGKATFNYHEDTRIALSGFWSTDRLDMGEGRRRVLIDWGNRVASANWNQYWTPKVNTRTWLTYNNYFYDIELASGIISVRDTINSVGLRTSTTWQFSGENEVSAGLEADYSLFRYNANFLGGFRFDITGQPLTTAAYVQGKLKPFSQLLIQPGLRVDDYYLTGDYNARHLRLSPRLSFKYFLNEITAIKGAAGRYYQFVSALYPEFSPIPSLFFWVPLLGSYPPQQADHYILGAERWLDENTNITLEGYYKRYGAIHEMNENVNPDSLSTTLLRSGTGYSWGLDFMLRRDWGKLTGWLSYSLAFARVKFDGLEYAPSYDRRHIINLVASYPLPWGLTANAHWSYGSGMPYTATSGYFRHWAYNYPYGFPNPNYDYNWEEIGSGKNLARYPDYHRLDLGLQKSFKLKGSKLDLNLEVINVYDQKNLLLYQWDYDQPVPQRISTYQFPLLPSLGLKWSF
jgi:hypothetical protein